MKTARNRNQNSIVNETQRQVIISKTTRTQSGRINAERKSVIPKYSQRKMTARSK